MEKCKGLLLCRQAIYISWKWEKCLFKSCKNGICSTYFAFKLSGLPWGATSNFYCPSSRIKMLWPFHKGFFSNAGCTYVHPVKNSFIFSSSNSYIITIKVNPPSLFLKWQWWKMKTKQEMLEYTLRKWTDSARARKHSLNCKLLLI